jgi:hypothetical protein
MVVIIAQGNYEMLIQRCAKSRLTSEDVQSAIREYGRKIIEPPVNAYQSLDVVPIRNAAVPTWSVRVPLWTEEEGRSDLTLEMTISLAHDHPVIELDDLHVL